MTDAVGSLLMTLRQVGDELQVSEDSVFRLIKSGQLAATDVGTGSRSRTRVQRSEVERFIKARTTASTRTTSRRGLRAAS